ncbi:MAG: hypothetical protein EBY29_16815 [Planctomycetes bacterium]|nr:hypothetical protein [Planctomycetota bacterium]
MGIDQTMATLAIGVVADEIERGHALQLVMGGFVFKHCEVVLLEVGIDESLDRTNAVRSVIAGNGEGNDIPAERVAEFVSSNFTFPKPVREVPQRSFADMGFIDHASGVFAQCRFGEEGCIRTPRHFSDQFDLAACNDFVEIIAD